MHALAPAVLAAIVIGGSPPEQGSLGIGAAAGAPEAGARGWDGPILPGHGATALLDVQCAAPPRDPVSPRDIPGPAWKAIPRERAAGLRGGDEVIALLEDGALARTRLGVLRCFPGECSGDWVVARLPGVSSRKRVVAVAHAGFMGEAATLAVPRRTGAALEACAPLPAARPPAGKDSGCDLYDLGGGERLQVHWADGDVPFDAWGPRWFWARPAGGDRQAPWTYLGHANGTNLLPGLAIRGEGPTRIVWIKIEGIQGPGFETVVVTRLRGDGLDVGRAFRAGGQPCD